MHRGRFEHRRLPVKGSSITCLIWLAAVIVPVLVLLPASAAASGHGQRARPSSRHIQQAPRSGENATVAAGHARRTTLPHRRRDHHITSHAVLALGSGYASRDGSGQVRALQRRLADEAFAPGPVDGLYGPMTERAVRRFQAAYGLHLDGITGPQTIAALNTRNTPLYPRAGYASGGSHPVRSLQNRLARAGSSPGALDGLYGARTEQAVRHFQAVHGLKPNGIAGPRTVSLLKERTYLRHRAGRRHTSRLRSGQRRAPARTPSRSAPRGALAGGGTKHGSGPSTLDWIALLGALGLCVVVAAGLYFRRGDRQRSDVVPAPSSENGRAAASQPEARPVCSAQERGELSEAETACRDADEKGDPDAAFRLGVLLEEQGDIAGARAAYWRADQRGHAAGASNLGVLLEQQGDLAGAQAAYARGGERGDATGAFNLGALLEEHGDLAGARTAYGRAGDSDHADVAEMARIALRNLPNGGPADGNDDGHEGPADGNGDGRGHDER